MGLAIRSAEGLIFALDTAELAAKRLFGSAESSLESALLSIEDRLRRKRAYEQLPPFVLDQEGASRLIEGVSPRRVVATFEENCYPLCYLAGKFPKGSVTTEQVRIVRGPTGGRGCRRLRFSMPAGEAHAEVFVQVKEDTRDWSGCRMMNLWYRGRSENTTLALTFTDGRGRRWFSRHSGIIAGGRWQLLRVPFTNFHCPQHPGGRKVQDLAGVGEMTIHLSCNPGSRTCRGRIDLFEAFVSG